MNGVDPEAFESAVGSVQDGAVFERFALAFLAAVLAHDFFPAAGIHDRGIDVARQILLDGIAERKRRLALRLYQSGKVSKSRAAELVDATLAVGAAVAAVSGVYFPFLPSGGGR